YDDRNGDHIKTNPYKCFMRIYGYEPGYSKWGILKLRLNVAAYTTGGEDDPNSFEAYASEGGQVDNDEQATHWGWQEDEWYHFKLEWGDGHMRWYKDGVLITDYDYSGTGEEYAPPIHIIRLGYVGVYETPIGEIFRNVKIVDATVPVEMSSFSAVVGHAVSLKWQTASETSNHGFEIERSADAKHYQRVGFVQGHGTTTESHTYVFQDRPPKRGTYWYRLRQIDVDGTSTVFGPIKVVWAPQKEVLLSNYPNPFNGQTRVHLFLPEAADLRVVVYDLTGREVARLHTGMLEAGEHTWTWNAHDELGRELPSGIYLLRANAGKRTLTRRVILLK
ncbi:MAG: T9SS type A sorting domain-containing protein, partial [Calditrichaeota bacterium]|nr:T9SS type A sorting domain-containing protein [Calditrichota bacterium]